MGQRNPIHNPRPLGRPRRSQIPTQRIDQRPPPPYENHAQIQGAVEGATQGRCRFVCLIVRGAGAAVVDGECGGIAGETQGQDCVFGGSTSRGEGQVRL